MCCVNLQEWYLYTVFHAKGHTVSGVIIHDEILSLFRGHNYIVLEENIWNNYLLWMDSIFKELLQSNSTYQMIFYYTNKNWEFRLGLLFSSREIGKGSFCLLEIFMNIVCQFRIKNAFSFYYELKKIVIVHFRNLGVLTPAYGFLDYDKYVDNYNFGSQNMKYILCKKKKIHNRSIFL